VNRLLIPAGCVLVQMVSLNTGGRHPAGVAAGVVAAAAALLSGLALLKRDAYPVGVLGVVTVGYFVQVTLGGPVLPAMAAVATERVSRVTAESGGRRSRARGLATLGAALALVAAAVLLSGNAFLAAPFGLLLLIAAYLGQFRYTRAVHEAQRRRDLVLAERLRIARDLHDVVGHGMGAITVQAGAARLAIAGGDHTAATRAVASIETAGRSVLREVRWLVGLLREDTERPGLGRVTELVSAARRSGMDVDLEVAGELDSPDTDSAEAAYRIVQEALTNVLRHSGDATARVSVRVASQIEVLVQNPVAVPGTAEEGNGLRGVRERAEALGGSVQLGPVPGGWTVRAALPISGRSR
jgi:signal transduction histidine kinase